MPAVNRVRPGGRLPPLNIPAVKSTVPSARSRTVVRAASCRSGWTSTSRCARGKPWILSRENPTHVGHNYGDDGRLMTTQRRRDNGEGSIFPRANGYAAYVRVHDARKTCATPLVDLDVHPRLIMRILRHADLAVTMEIYAKASSASTREALRRLGEALT